VFAVLVHALQLHLPFSILCNYSVSAALRAREDELVANEERLRKQVCLLCHLLPDN
jgi:hypothetical protein